MKKNNHILAGGFLAAVCFFIILFAVPVMSRDMRDPNMIVYQNADEGGLMDNLWYHYTGIIRPTFQWHFDYGIEMIYFAWLAKLFLGFIDMSPVFLASILGWFHIIMWAVLFFIARRFYLRHFRGNYEIIFLLLLAIQPAYIHFLGSPMKPDPLTAVIMVFGLDCVLRIIDSKIPKKYAVLAIFSAAAASTIKYLTGFFLLPAIVTGMVIRNISDKKNNCAASFPVSRAAWFAPGLAGLITLVFPVCAVFFYTRESTGTTMYHEFGLLGSLRHNNMLAASAVFGVGLIMVSLFLPALDKGGFFIKFKKLPQIQSLISCGLFTGMLFCAFYFLTGIGWLFKPKQFFSAHVWIAQILGNSIFHKDEVQAGLTRGTHLADIFGRISNIDPLFFAGMILFIVLFILSWRKEVAASTARTYKRILLLVYLLLALPAIFGVSGMKDRHLMMFNVALCALCLDGAGILFEVTKGGVNRACRYAVILALVFNLGLNCRNMALNYSGLLKRKEDMAYEIRKWWLKNIPKDASIAADHYIRNYIPEGYLNVRTLAWNTSNKAEDLRRFIKEYNPQYVYYGADKALPPDSIPEIQILMPGAVVKEDTVFDNKDSIYKNWRSIWFHIYKLR